MLILVLINCSTRLSLWMFLKNVHKLWTFSRLGKQLFLTPLEEKLVNLLEEEYQML